MFCLHETKDLRSPQIELLPVLEVICVHGNEGAVSIRVQQLDKMVSLYLPSTLRREKTDILR